jgi:hypothetical protein
MCWGESPAEAGNNDVCGCRLLPGGIVMALPMPPSLSMGETLDLARLIGQWRHCGVVPSLEALSWLLVESPEWQYGVKVGSHSEHGLMGCIGHRWRHFLSRCLLVDGPISPLTHGFLGT